MRKQSALCGCIVASLPFLAVVLSSCWMDADPFRLGYRRIAGEYELYESESRHYYILREGESLDGYGYVEGTVEELGWDTCRIFARRRSSFGDLGWMIIDLRSNVMEGPLSDEAFRSLFPNAVVRAAKDAWEKL